VRGLGEKREEVRVNVVVPTMVEEVEVNVRYALSLRPWALFPSLMS